MPNLDGFELTRAVRDGEDDSTSLPIIAVTANVLEGEAQRCLAAGMDDYLAKPIEMDRLREALVRWLPDAAASRPADVAPPRPGEDTDRPRPAPGAEADGGGGPPIDERALKDVFGDDPKVFREILGDFVVPARANVAEIMAASEARDAGAIGDASHKLKSSAKAVGAYELAEICVALEKAGKTADWEVMDHRSPELGSAFANVEDYIEDL